MPTVIKDFKIKESYAKLIEEALFSYLWEGIYKPMFDILNLKPETARNSLNAITEALKEGKIYYVDGGFKALEKFTNAQSTELKKWGAVYDKWEKIWRVPKDMIPEEIRVMVAEAEIRTANQLKQIDNFLKEVQANMPYIVDSMIFNDEVITILDDAGNEIKKNVRHLNVITPELTEQQKQLIAQTYTENVRKYTIKDFGDERIPEMRRKVQEAVLNGQRRDSVQKMLETEYEIMSRKVKFLARNETNIMLAEYKKVTYQEMGFDKFIWQTHTDGRERDLHKKLNGTTWSYDNPPIIDERTGQRGLPGQTYNCRCEAIPYRSDSPFKMETQKFNEAQSERRINKYLAWVNDRKAAKAAAKARNAKDDDTDWITVKGNHIPIKDGQTKEEAVKEFIAEKNGETVTTDGIIGDTVKAVYKAYKEANCESTEPAYQYPPTIAKVKRGKPMTFEQADGGRTNPYYHRDNWAYSHNCQSSVVAFEARMRGYDVQAAPRQRSGKSEQLAHHPSWAWIDEKTNKKAEFTGTKAQTPEQLKNWMINNIDKKGRYQFVHSWTDKKGNIHGHTTIVGKNTNNELYIYDPQTNRKYMGTSFNSYLKRITYKHPKYNTEPRILRVDTKKLNPYFMNDVLKSY